MGPRFGALRVPESWLPWHEAGVRCLLRDPAAESARPAGEAPSPVEALAVEEHPSVSARPEPSGESSARSAVRARPPEPSRPAVGPVPADRPARPEPPDQAVAPMPGAAAEAPWPPPWDGFLAKAPPAPRAVFAYLELGLDLCGQASDARRALFKDIAGALRRAGWPAGAIAFWPLAAPGPTGALDVDRTMFWRGVDRLGATTICLFGRPAWEALFPGRRHVFGPLREGRRVVLALPGPEDMLPDDRSAKQLAWKLPRTLDPAR